eukprot:TRINITY_DN17322_c0_g1_i1.p1 TRINITY_DN17322_c0_g1~~TRINITY_DN17322_c0_g1_i1.p1  ORF type:complete len:361 (+),score=90.10 TRINITY_DN17322_c0_g1_i1:34-1116(+)
MEENDELLILQNKLKDLERRHDDRVRGLLVEDDGRDEINEIARTEQDKGWVDLRQPKSAEATVKTVQSADDVDLLQPKLLNATVRTVQSNDEISEEKDTLPQHSPQLELDGDEFPPSPDAVADKSESTPISVTHRDSDVIAPTTSTALGDHNDQQIREYATLIGMDLDTEDSLLLHIAEEGYNTPLPDEWKWHSHDGEVYYINTISGETTWSNPVDAEFQKKYQIARALLAAVLLELHHLEDCSWMVKLPMTSITLTASSFADPNTTLYSHSSWGVGESEYQGEPTQITVEELSIPVLRNLATCTVSPATPGMVTLDVSTNSSGAVTHRWLEVEETEIGLVIVIREHSLAPGSVDYFPQF